ncbi:hypothetical protein [Flavobacterium sp. SOK18b]|uniref:hypothetical protein n=1 Tax=Flavobacterium sp. SOK18b TaxID=797900 RepID=UPI0015FC4726|nr:hypothetical protein [Flavobacterium sp. SOK18b]
MDNSKHNYMQKDVNIRISNVCKSQLDWLKKTYSFTTFNECISQIHYFFKVNNIAPNEQISNIFLKNFEELKFEINNLKKVMKDDFKANEKILKISERDIWTPMNRKINALFENKNIQSIESRNESLIKKAEEPNKIWELDKKIISLTRDLSSKNQLLISMEKTIEGINEDLGFYRRLHQILKENTKIEKQLISKDKVVIEWDIDDWKDILEYREVFKRKR